MLDNRRLSRPLLNTRERATILLLLLSFANGIARTANEYEADGLSCRCYFLNFKKLYFLNWKIRK